MIRVKATREGLYGGTTASGWIIDKEFPFVALPSHDALGRWVRIYNPLNGKHCCAQVRDVGPFNTNDNSYVIQPATTGAVPATHPTTRPKAEIGISISGDGTNKAGIDLGDAVWNLLDMKDNTEVDWEFIPTI